MAQPLRCDVHDDHAGVLLIQNLAEGKIVVGCPECVHDMVYQLAVSIGVAAVIAEEAQQELYKQVEQQKKAATPSRSRKGASKSVEPQDTGDAGESTVAPE